jgi:hypothetical protein
MINKKRICENCKGPLISRNHKTRFCSDPICKEDRKEKNRKKRFCRICEIDITNLYPKAVCQKQSCIDAWEIEKIEKRKKHNRKMYLEKKKIKNKRMKLKVNNTKRRPKELYDKNDEDYFDHSMFLEQQKELKKPNGNICKCGAILTGNYYERCPTCVKTDSVKIAGTVGQ